MNEWEHKAAICELINKYSGIAGRLHAHALGECFAPDAQVHGVAPLLGQPEPLTGLAAIIDFFDPVFGGLEWLVQQNTITDVVLSEDGRSATASTNLVESAQRKGAETLQLTGRYEDELVWTAQGWRFGKRTLKTFQFRLLEAGS